MIKNSAKHFFGLYVECRELGKKLSEKGTDSQLILDEMQNKISMRITTAAENMIGRSKRKIRFKEFFTPSLIALKPHIRFLRKKTKLNLSQQSIKLYMKRINEARAQYQLELDIRFKQIYNEYLEGLKNLGNLDTLKLAKTARKNFKT